MRIPVRSKPACVRNLMQQRRVRTGCACQDNARHALTIRMMAVGNEFQEGRVARVSEHRPHAAQILPHLNCAAVIDNPFMRGIPISFQRIQDARASARGFNYTTTGNHNYRLCE